MSSQQLKPNYAFSPSLLNAFQRMLDTKAEEYFYKDESGAWHLNWNESEGELHFSEEEVEALLKQEFIDTVNKVPQPPSEAASKGTAFNEIVDCIVMNRKPKPDFIIESLRGYDIKREEGAVDEVGKPIYYDYWFEHINKPCIYASVNGFEYYFDMDMCKEMARYFKDSICQFFTKCNLQTSLGVVEIHGFIDYLRRSIVYDLKTTKKYSFGDYSKNWQRYAYPFMLIESGLMNDVDLFEFTVNVLKGGTATQPLITSSVYREIYNYDHEQSRAMLTNQCERLIEFLEENKDLITNKKVFANYGTNN